MSENIIKVMDKIISELFLFLFQRSGKFIVHGAHFHACVLACQDTVGNIFKYEGSRRDLPEDLPPLSDIRPAPAFR